MGLSQKKIDEVFTGVYSGEILIESLPRELSKYTYDEIIRFIEEGFGSLSNDAKIARMVSYDANITAFSGAKTFQQVKDLHRFVFNEDGSKRAFKEFREFAQIINNQYNVTWLKTEQDTAFSMSQGADKWMDFETDKETFPMLRYQTAADERVRPEHADWDNLTFPVDDPFWNTRMPSNGWNCRCTVIKLTEGKTSSRRRVPENSEKMFAVNPGKVDYIFDEKKHPYFKHTRAEGPDFKRSMKWKKT